MDKQQCGTLLVPARWQEFAPSGLHRQGHGLDRSALQPRSHCSALPRIGIEKIIARLKNHSASEPRRIFIHLSGALQLSCALAVQELYLAALSAACISAC